jgi:hypothetical protein
MSDQLEMLSSNNSRRTEEQGQEMQGLAETSLMGPVAASLTNEQQVSQCRATVFAAASQGSAGVAALGSLTMKDLKEMCTIL